MMSQKELSAVKNEAKAKGLSRYFGNICAIHPNLNGERVIWNGTCYECYKIGCKERSRKWHTNNPEKYATTNKKYAKRKQERANERYIENPQKVLDNHKKWRDKPNVKIYLRKKASSWKNNNRSRATANQIKRKSAQLNATPSWVNLSDILPFYELASSLSKKTGVAYHVDHIVPLKGKNVCGLHVPWNLQVIPAIDNLRKTNKLILD